MADIMFVKDAAKLWNITERRVSALCKAGKIEGAIKQGKSWIIPTNANKPADNRVKTGAYKTIARPANLPLPIGISDYRLASSEYYYIDKTMMFTVWLSVAMSFGIMGIADVFVPFFLGEAFYRSIIIVIALKSLLHLVVLVLSTPLCVAIMQLMVMKLLY